MSDPLAGLSIGQLALYLVVAAGVVAVAYVAVTAMGIAVPGFVITIFWIIVVCLIAALAIRLIMRIGGGGGPTP
jgi:hypothetical protein